MGLPENTANHVLITCQVMSLVVDKDLPENMTHSEQWLGRIQRVNAEYYPRLMVT